MINALNDTVIIRLPFQQVTIRWNGVDRKVMRFQRQGFAQAEYQDSNVFQVTSPFDDWISTTLANSNNPDQQIYFCLESSPGFGNPGQDDEQRSLINSQLDV